MTTIEERLRECVRVITGCEDDTEIMFSDFQRELAARGLAVVDRKLIADLLGVINAVTITKVGDDQFVQFTANGYHGALNARTPGVSGKIVKKCLHTWDQQRTDAVKRAREMVDL